MDSSKVRMMPHTRVASWLAVLFTSSLLAGCGGGGYGGGSSTGQTLAPTISTQPTNVTVTAGQPANFSVVVTGFMPITLQWQRDGVDIMGATQTSYTLASATPADNGAMFHVRASNIYGSVTSTNATLTVN